jgi:hypothetical protein
MLFYRHPATLDQVQGMLDRRIQDYSSKKAGFCGHPAIAAKAALRSRQPQNDIIYMKRNNRELPSLNSVFLWIEEIPDMQKMPLQSQDQNVSRT